jgi:hypothetical protein
MKTVISKIVIVFSTVGLFSLQNVQAVVPPPDGAYPSFTTAEGQNALQSLTTGAANTALGAYSLFANTIGSFNTAVGAGALDLNTGDNNTAVGVAALLLNTGTDNTGVGVGALGLNTTGEDNAAIGTFALHNNVDGNANTAVGVGALFSHQTGGFNNAFGWNALESDQTGGSNNGFGSLALQSNVSGSGNTAVGDQALEHSTGGNNTAIGFAAGQSLIAGNGNVYIGASFTETPSTDSNHTYIRNINNTSVSGGGTDTVTVDLTTGLIGHLSSSRRYKEEIKPMNNASEALFALNPVTYRYKKEIDHTESPAFGLIAEDVAEVNPNLVARNAQGEVESIHYEMVNAMLLNEFLKEHRHVQEQDSVIARQQKQIEALSAGLQKVSAQLELNKPAPHTVENYR